MNLKFFRQVGRLVSLCLLAWVSGAGGCQKNMSHPPTIKRDINAVLAANDKRLLAIHDVVGVYVGLLEDGRTPCLKVMLARKTPENERAIPHTLEGYPVVTEVTGEIRPFRKP